MQVHYAQAHAVIMPGVMEGWPKPIAEAWAHGAVPLAAAGGIVPWILRDKEAGVTFPPTGDGLANALLSLLADATTLTRMSERGPDLARKLSLECFTERLERVLVEGCGLQ